MNHPSEATTALTVAGGGGDGPTSSLEGVDPATIAILQLKGSATKEKAVAFLEVLKMLSLQDRNNLLKNGVTTLVESSGSHGGSASAAASSTSLIGRNLHPHIQRLMGKQHDLFGTCKKLYLEIDDKANGIKDKINFIQQNHPRELLTGNTANKLNVTLTQDVNNHLRQAVNAIREAQLNNHYLDCQLLAVYLKDYGIHPTGQQKDIFDTFMNDYNEFVQAIRASLPEHPWSRYPNCYLVIQAIKKLVESGDHWPSTVEEASIKLLVHSILLDIGYSLDYAELITPLLAAFTNNTSNNTGGETPNTTTTTTTTTSSSSNSSSYNYYINREFVPPHKNPSSSKAMEISLEYQANKEMEKAMVEYNNSMKGLDDIEKQMDSWIQFLSHGTFHL